ncbi:MAG: leucine--tRNA ligase [Methanomicrobiales archaeon]|nr:leucine--tRNA ligase [Methanomicrobiales archaeon]
MSSPDIRRIERDILPLWEHAFEPDPTDGEKFYLTVAYPYPSGAMHVGHGRTYIAPDVIARFWRMRGKTVLYPMAFHVTGAPVIGISKRIARGDPKAVSLYRDLYKVPEDVLAQFVDPLAIVRHFSDEYQRVMGSCGISIDWRRRFTTVDPQYSRFIEWQWKHLREGNHVLKGAHPVRYCPQCDNPVGDHDLLEGDKAEILRFTLVMFRWNDAVIPTATLRPETIYGVTNLWVNPGVTYVRILLDGVPWIVSREAAEKLSFQDHTVEITGEIPGEDLIDQTVSHPLCGDVPILPARFVDPDMASGIVMSVPAHAPFDYIALRDLQAAGKYTGIEPVPLITVPGYGTFPAQDAVERAGIANQDDPRMEAITQEVYGAEFAQGRLFDRYGGISVREARDTVASLMMDQYGSMPMYEFDTRSVVCRCGSKVVVKILHDQWFLQYSDPVWKEEVASLLSRMDLVPPEVRAEFERTIDWLKDWACTRRVGLGTRLPWDPDWLIEPLSDSTVYMAYYTIAHHLKSMPADLLTPEVFDYIFLGKETPGLPERQKLDLMRKEFLFWYPYDFRFSAKDLISNHLTFQLFHHVAIFPEPCLPRGMVVFGMGLLNGAKMSSSKGNVFLLEDAVDEFGADTVRMFLVGSAEPWQDFDWRNELVASTRKQIDRFMTTVLEGRPGHERQGSLDHWLESRLQGHIARTTEALERFQTRQALQEAFFGIESDLKWYRRRIPADSTGSPFLADLFSAWVRLLSPVIPFTCEFLWKELGGEGLVSYAPWPVPDSSAVDSRVELAEELLARTVEDIESILKIIQLEPSAITIYTAPSWKKRVFSAVAAAENKNTVIREIMKDAEMRTRGKEATDAVRQCTTLIHRLPPQVVTELCRELPDEEAIFSAAAGFLSREFSVPVSVRDAGESPHAKAALALPFKPAIVIE